MKTGRVIFQVEFKRTEKVYSKQFSYLQAKNVFTFQVFFGINDIKYRSKT